MDSSSRRTCQKFAKSVNDLLSVFSRSKNLMRAGENDIMPPTFKFERMDAKQIVRISQEKTVQIVRGNNIPEFGARLRDAFNDAKNVDIARELKVSEAAVRNYISGRVPDAEMLILIFKRTGCSIHWLITGEGAKAAGVAEAHGEKELKKNDETARGLIEALKKIIDEQVSRAVEDALKKRK